MDNRRRIDHILVGNSPSIERIRQQIYQVSNSDVNVLILGESGVGKEIIARCLHYLSHRNGSPFVPVNCGAIPGDLLESELFGHEKGAFTGALTSRKGRFELAMGGTLFLDEIGDMPLAMQVKLLRVLQERSFERVGSNKTIHADCRIIAATHRNLEQAIEEGSFREDLYYRLNVFPIDTPPLRERPEDIPMLLQSLANTIEKENGHRIQFSAMAIQVLQQYAWPGNVRELSNLIERLAVAHPNKQIDLEHIPNKYRANVSIPEAKPTEVPSTNDAPSGLALPVLPADGFNLKQYLMQTEKSMIRQALDLCDGVVAHAANYLKMRRTTLVEKMRKYDIHRFEMEEQEEVEHTV